MADTTPVEFPGWLHGTYKDVRRRCTSRVRSFVQGTPLRELDAGTPLDARQAPGLIVMDRMWSAISASDPQFHLDLFWTALAARVRKDRTLQRLYESVAEDCVKCLWAFAGLAGSQHYRVVRRASQQLVFLKAASTHWPLLASLGQRFSVGHQSGESLERHAQLVRYCLARQGAQPLGLQPLSPSALAQMMSKLPGTRVQSLVAANRLEEAAAIISEHQGIAMLSLAEHLVDCGHDDFACSTVRSIESPDPHHIGQDWLNGKGDPARIVR